MAKFVFLGFAGIFLIRAGMNGYRFKNANATHKKYHFRHMQEQKEEIKQKVWTDFLFIGVCLSEFIYLILQ